MVNKSFHVRVWRGVFEAVQVGYMTILVNGSTRGCLEIRSLLRGILARLLLWQVSVPEGGLQEQ
jgi:predicted NBD/HSP70 family sugar kinase